MSPNADLALLVVAYKRLDNVARIVRIATECGIQRVYISVDGYKGSDQSNESLELINTLRSICDSKKILVEVRFLKSNIGCSANLLSSCDWVFASENFVTILEDDCIPRHGFFDYARESFPYLDKKDDVWMACGAQFAPDSITEHNWAYSRYALIWGWTTTRMKWNQIATVLSEPKNIGYTSRLSLAEISFWNSGARRAIQGYVDAWDTVLVQQMLRLKKFALLPGENLVENVGNDNYATHTQGDSPWMNRKTYPYSSTHLDPIPLVTLDQWLKSSFYRINLAHLFRYPASIIRDYLLDKGKIQAPLIDRWVKSKSELAKLVQIS